MSYEIINNITGQFLLSSDINKSTLKKLLKHSNLNSIQFSEPVTDNNVWVNIKEIIFQRKPELELYVYSNHNKPWDLSFLELFPNLKAFGVSGYMECSNINSIGSLNNLKSLSINIYNLENIDFLDKINSSLKSLILGNTKSKKFDISILSRFDNLVNLSVWGHKRGVEEISKLSSLEKLQLSVNLENLDFISHLDKLRSVKLSFSEIKNLNALTKLKSLKYLDIYQLRKLSNIEFISELKSLKYLVLANLPNIVNLPDFSLNKQLRRIDFENLKGLTNLKSIEFAEVLEEFRFVNCSHLQPDDLLPVLRNKSIKDAIAGFGSNIKNNKFDQLKTEFGMKKHNWNEFIFK
ncbi:hypothetical protein [Polaribacter sp. Asnod1-A03]|uniref:hypothetical protein n=1 Tax=Polaribacter sp. Asnod1-A03 TaxID=3160581 RepID=UPI0038708930